MHGSQVPLVRQQLLFGQIELTSLMLNQGEMIAVVVYINISQRFDYGYKVKPLNQTFSAPPPDRSVFWA